MHAIFYLTAFIVAAYGIFSLIAFPALHKNSGQLLGCGIAIGLGLGIAYTAWLLPILIESHDEDSTKPSSDCN